MLIDLHSHYPMHVAAGEAATLDCILNAHRPSLRDKIRAWALRVASKIHNYQGPGASPAVTLSSLQASSVGALLSVLYVPFDEMDLSLAYGSPPRPVYFEDLLRQLEQVEDSLAGQSEAVVVRTPAELDAAVSAGKISLIHAVEGGFQLGHSITGVRDNVEELARRGVAYVTIAHLFWRGVATNAPGIPFVPDWLYRMLFPQKSEGLGELGRAAIEAMVSSGVLVDATHMSPDSFADTIRLLDDLDVQKRIPLLASHAACRFREVAYDLTDEQVLQIAERNGIIGLIASRHYMAGGFEEPRNYGDSVDIVCSHADHIRDLTGSWDHVGIGSDQDGFIKPALPGLETPIGLGGLEADLTSRYGQDVARQICHGNARRVLNSWRA